MANIIQLKDDSNAVFYPQTHEKAVIDSNGVTLQTKLASISAPSYVVAWDGTSTPVVANIPAGVTFTFGGTTYTGTLAASASTVNKTYLVGDNNGNFDEYVTQKNGNTYSWIYLGNTAINISGFATDAELEQVETKMGDLEDLQTTDKTNLVAAINEAAQTGSGGGGSSLSGYVVVDSVENLPDPGVATLGYLIGTDLYLYVGTGGDTLNGKYQNCGPFRGPAGASGVGFASVSSQEDGTVVITLTNGDSITIDLNHSHPQYLKYVYLTSESQMPATPESTTLYLIKEAE